MELDFDIGGGLYNGLENLIPDSVNYNMDLGVLNGLFGAQFGISVTKLYNDLDAQYQPDKSNLGVPFWKKDVHGRNMFCPVTLGGQLLPIPVITIDTATNWVIRKMGRRKGTVKGNFGADDYMISIRGFCIAGGNRWPEEQIQMLKDLDEARTALPIENVLTAIFLDEPQTAVITHLKIFETSRFQGLVPYQMDLLSDVPFTLIEEE